MPSGIPVATVALNGAKNAGILAAKILCTHILEIKTKMIKFQQEQTNKTLQTSQDIHLHLCQGT